MRYQRLEQSVTLLIYNIFSSTQTTFSISWQSQDGKLMEERGTFTCSAFIVGWFGSIGKITELLSKNMHPR